MRRAHRGDPRGGESADRGPRQRRAHVVTRLMRQLPRRSAEDAHHRARVAPRRRDAGDRHAAEFERRACRPCRCPALDAVEPGPVVVTRGTSQLGARRSDVPSRPSTTRMRAITPSLIPPRGSSPEAIGRAHRALRSRRGGAAPHRRCSACTICSVVRAVTFDENSGDIVDALVPVSDAPPGGFEASRAAEIARWEQAIGGSTLGGSAQRGRGGDDVPHAAGDPRRGRLHVAAIAVLNAAAGAAFPSRSSPLGGIDRYAAPRGTSPPKWPSTSRGS